MKIKRKIGEFKLFGRTFPVYVRERCIECGRKATAGMSTDGEPMRWYCGLHHTIAMAILLQGRKPQ